MLRISDIFFRQSIDDLAKNELKEARKGLLQAQAGLEWAQAMVTYHQTRINRLNAYFETQDHDRNDPETPAITPDPAAGLHSWHVRRSY